MAEEMKWRTVDPAAIEMLDIAEAAKITTVFDRYKAQLPQCKFGQTGICCRICIQGPCRIIPTKKGADKGICGADAYSIVSRNLVRYIAGGASAHSDHGREIAQTLLAAVEGHAPDYKVTDAKKLDSVAKRVGVPTEGRDVKEIAKDVAVKALNDFGKIDYDPCTYLYTIIDEERIKKFTDTNIMTSAIDRSVVEVLHQTHMGTDADPINIIFGGLKAALGDLTGESLATDISDILFGTPVPIVTEANMGVLKEDQINIAVHGHNPLLSEMVVYAARELKAEAEAVGAKGINLVGICCTGNEVLMREGVPTVTNFGSQELAIMTGVLDVMVVDVQCIMPSTRDICECFHTKLITTSPISKNPGTMHVNFNEGTAMNDARKIVRIAIEQFGKRNKSLIHIPQYKKQVVGGFSVEALTDLFAKVRPENPLSLLTDAIASGQIKGVAAFAGCNNQKVMHDEPALKIATFLAQNDVFLVSTGCAAGAYAKAGLLSHEGIEKYAGPGLKKFLLDLEAVSGVDVGLPLVFHMGSCVDNSRVATFWSKLAGTMGVPVPQFPFVASAPEAMSEKAVAIGSWVISNGIPCHVGVMPPVQGSDLVFETCTSIARDVFGGYFILETDPDKAAAEMLRRLENRMWLMRVRQEAAKKYEGKYPTMLYEGC